MFQRLFFSVFCCGQIAALLCTKSFAQNPSDALEQFVGRAEIVAVGRVSETRSAWNTDRSRIVTHVTLTVDEFLKGESDRRSLVFSVPGGEVDGVGELYTHTPKFAVNEAVLLFLQRADGGALRVVGGEAGKLTITEDRLTGKKVVGENQLLEVFTTRIKSAIKHQQQK